MQNKIKHLEMIESIIERMAKNSFQLKGWTMTIVAAIIALTANDIDKKFCLFVFVPITCFWILDSYYLYTERKFRFLYDDVTKKEDKDIDFQMKTSQYESLKEYFKCMFFSTEAVFYASFLISVLLVLIILGVIGLPNFCKCGVSING